MFVFKGEHFFVYLGDVKRWFEGRGLSRAVNSLDNTGGRPSIYSNGNCVWSCSILAKRTPRPIRRTAFPVRAKASPSNERNCSRVGNKPARSTVVRVKSANFNFTKILVISRVDSFCARSARRFGTCAASGLRF